MLSFWLGNTHELQNVDIPSHFMCFFFFLSFFLFMFLDSEILFIIELASIIVYLTRQENYIVETRTILNQHLFFISSFSTKVLVVCNYYLEDMNDSIRIHKQVSF